MQSEADSLTQPFVSGNGGYSRYRLIRVDVTVCDIFSVASCYAGLYGRDRPLATFRIQTRELIYAVNQANTLRPMRAVAGFVIAPPFPAVLLYFYNFFWMGFGNEAVVGPFILGLLGYVAASLLGVPLYALLQRKGVRSLRVYGLLGALIGPVFFILFEALTAYEGTVFVTLQHSYRAGFTAAAYSTLAALAFWAIACWPGTKGSVAQ